MPAAGLTGAALAEVAERLGHVTVRVREGDTGEGSGVVLHSRGLVVTNAHVARRRPTVVLRDGRALPARVLAWDPELDLAVLDVEAAGLPAAEIGDARTLRVGALVLAIGHPFGLARALSVGVVHSLGAGDGGLRVIRADLRLAPGNSGGPLADARGRVVGINTMIAGGLAVAAPIHLVEQFLSASLWRRREAAGVP